MKRFFKPSLWKIVTFIIFLALFWFISSFVLSFIGITNCPLDLPTLPSDSPSPSVSASPATSISPTEEPSPTLEPYSLIGTVGQIPNAITGNYDTCNPTSPSLTAAIRLWNNSIPYLIALFSYILSCGLVALINKIKNRNVKK
jgi:hypothetical protein